MIDYHRINTFRIQNCLSWQEVADEVALRTGIRLNPQSIRKIILFGSSRPSLLTKRALTGFAIYLEQKSGRSQ